MAVLLRIRAVRGARRRGSRTLAGFALCASLATGCGGLEQPSLDAGSEAAPPSDAAADVPAEADTCGQDPQVCSWVVYRSGCFGASTVGSLCDFLATPCVQPPPDCASLGDLLGTPVVTQACGGGSSCIWSWSGTIDPGVFDQLCAMHAKAGVSVDCMQN